MTRLLKPIQKQKYQFVLSYVLKNVKQAWTSMAALAGYVLDFFYSHFSDWYRD